MSKFHVLGVGHIQNEKVRHAVQTGSKHTAAWLARQTTLYRISEWTGPETWSALIEWPDETAYELGHEPSVLSFWLQPED